MFSVACFFTVHEHSRSGSRAKKRMEPTAMCTGRRAAPMTEQYHTKEGTTLTRQTGKLEWTFIKRTFDKRYQAIADEGQNGFTPEKAAAFLTSVYTPVVTSGT